MLFLRMFTILLLIMRDLKKRWMRKVGWAPICSLTLTLITFRLLATNSMTHGAVTNAAKQEEERRRKPVQNVEDRNSTIKVGRVKYALNQRKKKLSNLLTR